MWCGAASFRDVLLLEDAPTSWILCESIASWAAWEADSEGFFEACFSTVRPASAASGATPTDETAASESAMVGTALSIIAIL